LPIFRIFFKVLEKQVAWAQDEEEKRKKNGEEKRKNRSFRKKAEVVRRVVLST
jgi:hypothetical protein